MMTLKCNKKYFLPSIKLLSSFDRILCKRFTVAFSVPGNGFANCVTLYFREAKFSRF